MKFERINDNKIKVTVNHADLKLLQIDYSHILYNTPEARIVFEELMREAKQQVDFDACNSTLMVEAAPIPEDGFVMVVTKLDEGFDMLVQNKPKRVHAVSVLVYRFDCFEDVLQWALRKDVLPFAGTRLYELESKYYLICRVKFIDSRQKNILKEYAEKQPDGSKHEGILSEYGNMIIPSRVITALRKYF